MRGHTEANGRKTGGDDVWDHGSLGKHEGERSGPEFRGQAGGGIGHSVTSDFAISMEATWTMSGLVAGRPLTA